MNRALLATRAPFLTVFALVIVSFSITELLAADTDGALLAGIPDPPNSTALGTSDY
jgi:hypothetical protein